MKLLLSVLFLSVLPAFGQGCAGTWANGYGFCRQIKIDHTKVPNTNQTNFTVKVFGTYSYLATVANSGNVQSASGFDIIFTSDNAGTTLLNWDQEAWSATNGAVIYNIGPMTLSTSVDFIFYVFYGKTGVASFQGGAAGSAYDGNTFAVFHMNDNAASTVVVDSSSGAHNAATTPNNTSVFTTAGQIGTALAFTGTNYIQLANSTVYDLATATTPVTWSLWVNTTGNCPLITIRSSSSGNPILAFSISSNRSSYTVRDDTGGGLQSNFDTSVPNDGTWHFLAWTRSAAKLVIPYDNSVNTTGGGSWTDTMTAGVTGNALNRTFAQDVPAAAGCTSATAMDEVVGSSVVRSPDWITTMYNNQSSPTTFYTMGTQQTSSGGSVPGQFPKVADAEAAH